MATRVWNGGAGDWTDPEQWTTTSTDLSDAPQPGDTATIAGGDLRIDGVKGLNGAIYNGVALTIGDAANDPANLHLSSAYLENFFSIQAQGSATIDAGGMSALACKVSSAGPGTVLTLVGDGATPNGLLLTRGGGVTVQPGATLDLEGTITDQASASITTQAGSTLVNDAAVTAVGPLIDIKGALAGAGIFTLMDATTLFAEGSVSAGQTIRFGDVDGLLKIAQPDQFEGAVTGFSPGNLIDLTATKAMAASYDAASGTLTLRDGSGAAVAAVQNVQAAPGQLVAANDGAGGTMVSYAGTEPRKKYQIAGGDRAMRADVVRDTMTVPGTSTPITGAGVKVGIISNGFDTVAPGAADADAAAGYLPSNSDGTSAVTVLSDNDSSSDDEGRAMAELIHQAAPGAQLYFAAQGSSQTDFAGAATALAQAGCNVIVDDVTWTHSPFYQVASGLDVAVSAAVAQGISVFTSAGNYGQAFLEQPFAPQQTTLADGTAAAAQVFGNGTPCERITVPANTTSHIDLQWTAPFQGLGGAGAPDALTLEVFDTDGNVLGTGNVQKADGVPTTDLAYYFPVLSSAADYQIAVCLNDGQVSPDAFKFILSAGGSIGGTGPGGIIHDPAASQGSGDLRGQQLIPGVNTVGESYFANSAAFGLSPTYDEYASDEGPGTLLYDGAGNPLPSPQDAGKIDFDAPDGIPTTVPAFSPFYGTSAAAPNAAAVAALMLQANPSLTPAQVTTFMHQSALDQGLAPAQQGAGLVQADGAVALSIAAEQPVCIPITPDTVSIDPGVAFDGEGIFTLTGQAAAASGVAGVGISALIGGVQTDFGAATVDGNGAFTFREPVGAVSQRFITVTLIDGTGGTASARANFSLQAGIADEPYVGRQESYDPSTGAFSGSDFFARNGSVL